MVKSDPQTESTHFLLVVVKDDEVSIDSIVLRDKMEEGHADVAKCDEVLTLHLLVESIIAYSVIQSRLGSVKVVSDFKYGSLSL